MTNRDNKKLSGKTRFTLHYAALNEIHVMFLRAFIQCLQLQHALVFPHTQRIYSNVKTKHTDAIQNNNIKRFELYLNTENGCFNAKEI